MAFACAVILLVACGGGGGGGGGASAFKLRMSTVNETADAATVTFDVAGEPGEPQTLESCRATLYTFDLPEGEDWAMTINGNIAVDSVQLDPNLLDANLIGEITVNEDGTIEITEEIVRGALITPPAASGICLPG
jgi:hypothetical protein